MKTSVKQIWQGLQKFQLCFCDYSTEFGKRIKLFYKQLKCFVFCQNMNGRKAGDVFVSCKCFSNFSEKPWLKLFEGHEMVFFYAAKVLLSLYEKKKESFLSETFFILCEMVLPF